MTQGQVFDPWSASEGEALAAQRAYRDTGGPSPAGPIFQWSAAKNVLSRREKIAAGDGYAVMYCVHLCVWHGLVAPDWLARAFLRRFRLVSRAEVGSWDEAFGRPWKKGVHLNRIRRRQEVGPAIVNAVVDAVAADPSRAVDQKFWEEIGKIAGVGKTLAEELYRSAIRPNSNLGIAKLRASSGLRVSTAKSRKLAGMNKRR